MEASQDPSKILEQARQQLEALKKAGLSRETLLALLDEDSQHQSQQSQLQQQGPGEGSGIPAQNFHHFIPSHQVRSSVSSTASGSSGKDSILSTSTGRSSISTTSRSSASSTSSEARYFCTSCDKTFKRKFDWKRHEEEFHERWRKYPCPNCNQSFWGPNTFNQHHKSAHGCKSCPHSDAVVKYMRKRRAWGCGFCAAMHTKLEKHYEHVATHFESGSRKEDWLHSNVIYGLLHQPAVHEAWKELLARKQDKFNGQQPLFSWGPEKTGRAQGYVENEHPGQLQDFLEFFDGSSDSAEKIARCAWGYCHVVLKPSSASGGTPFVQESVPAPSSDGNTGLQRRVSIKFQSGGLRRTASTSLMPVSRPSVRRVSSAASYQSSFSLSPTMEQNSPYQNFIQPPPVPSQSLRPDSMQMSQAPLSLNKELPPAPMMSSPMDPSPMDVDYNMFGTSSQPMGQQPMDQQSIGQQSMSQQSMKLEPMDQDSMNPETSMMDEWQSLTSTLIGDQTMAAQTQGFPMSWDNMGQFQGQPGS